MDYIKLWQICACFVIAPHCLTSSVAQDVAECSPRCWNPVQLNSGVLGATYQGWVSEEECKALCVNNGTCIGIDWFPITTECWFQLTALPPYNTNANHWSLANCTDVAECSPRCWNPVQLYYGVWGATYQEGVANEEDCKALCVNNGTCIGIDWIRFYNECWFQLTALSPYKNANANHWSLANCTATVRTGEVTSSTVNVGTTSHTTTSACKDTKYSKESTTEWKTGVIVLAVLLGLCIIGLAINTIRIGRQLNLKSDVKSAELDNNYEGIQRPETRAISEDGTCTDLDQINPEEFAYEQTNC